MRRLTGLVVVASLVSSCVGTGSETTVSTTTPSTSTSSRPPVTSGVIGELDGPDVHWRVFDLETQGPVILVAERMLHLDVTGTVWSSADGSEWRATGSLVDMGIADRVFVRGINRMGSRVAAWGGYEPAGTEDEVAAIWVSMDGGETWAMPDLPGVTHVVSTPDGFAAVGFRHDRTSVFTNDMTGWVRISADGVHWELLFESEDPEGYGSGMFRGVWHGGLVVTGSQSPHFLPDEDKPEPPDDWPHFRSVWLDGSAASRPASYPGSIWQFVSTHWGIIGVAPYGPVPGTLWVSPTGVDWSQVDLGEGWRVTVADYANGTLYVSAWHRSDGNTALDDAGIWISDDGESWRLIPVPVEVPEGLNLSVEGSRVVLVGWGGPGDGSAKIAIGTILPNGD